MEPRGIIVWDRYETKPEEADGQDLAFLPRRPGDGPYTYRWEGEGVARTADGWMVYAGGYLQDEGLTLLEAMENCVEQLW